MKFVDEATIDVASGNGAPGAVTFRREKYRPKLGPDGGNGGNGGDLYFQASTDLQSLLDFRFQPTYHAEDGQKGTGNDRDGRGGEDLIIKVPVGTIVYDLESGEFLADLVELDRKVLLFRGGRGGMGNRHFATATRQAPDFAQPGEPGVRRKVRMELKLLADVALLGFPNAGKSTLISKMSAARPKIADYPFTTLVPNLGVVRGRGLDFVIADIPGIIEGASEGRGLGLRFLKHCERSRMVLILLDLDPNTNRTVTEDYDTLLREMNSFSEDLATKEKLVFINKIDLSGDCESRQDLETAFAEKDLAALLQRLDQDKVPYLFGSAATGARLPELKDAISDRLLVLGPAARVNRVNDDLRLGNQSLFFEQAVIPASDDEQSEGFEE